MQHWVLEQAIMGNESAVCAYITAGGDISIMSNKGQGILILASYAGMEDVLSLLLERVITVDAVDIEGRSALSYAALNGHQGIVISLLEAGSDCNQLDDHGFTPLMLAALKGHSDVVKILLKSGADKRIYNHYGSNALKLAMLHQPDMLLIRLLLVGEYCLQSELQEAWGWLETELYTPIEKNIELRVSSRPLVGFLSKNISPHILKYLGESQHLTSMIKALCHCKSWEQEQALHYYIGYYLIPLLTSISHQLKEAMGKTPLLTASVIDKALLISMPYVHHDLSNDSL